MKPKVYVETTVVSYSVRSNEMWKDPIVEEVRKVRNEHAARFKYDLTAICRDLKEHERASGRHYVRFAPKRLPVKKAG